MRHLSHGEFIERSIDATMAFMDRPQAEAYLGDDLATLRQDAEGLYIPEVDGDGVVALSSDQQASEKTPIIARSVGERLFYGDGFDKFTPAQREHAVRRLGQFGSLRAAEDYVASFEASMAQETELEAIDGGSNCLWTGCRKGIFDSPPVPAEIPPHALALFRPLIGLLRPPFQREHPASPVAMLHELVHIGQLRQEPIALVDNASQALEDKYWGRELEAIKLGAKATKLALAVDDRAVLDDPWRAYSLALDYEAARREHTTEADPYAVSRELISRLMSIGLAWDHVTDDYEWR